MENPNEWCEQKWYAEVEAYRKECEFAQRIGAGKALPLCTEAGGLDRKLLKSAMLQGEANAAMCKEVWRNL